MHSNWCLPRVDKPAAAAVAGLAVLQHRRDAAVPSVGGRSRTRVEDILAAFGGYSRAFPWRKSAVADLGFEI